MALTAGGTSAQQALESNGAATLVQCEPDRGEWKRVVPGATAQWQSGQAPEHSADSCSKCYQELKEDNADCAGMTGLDWKICREAADVEFKRCSQDC